MASHGYVAFYRESPRADHRLFRGGTMMAVYLIQSPHGGPVKIGHSADVGARLKELQVHYGQPLILLGVLPGGREEELSLHVRFAAHRLGRTEQFHPVAEIMDHFVPPTPKVAAITPAGDAAQGVERKTRVQFHLSETTAERLGVHASLVHADKSRVVEEILLGWLRKHGLGRELFDGPGPATGVENFSDPEQ